jgi:hypothetical protein
MYELPQQNTNFQEMPIYQAIKQRSITPFYKSRNFGKEISQSISNPTNYIGVGRVVDIGKPTTKFLKGGKKLDKSLVNKLRDTFQVNSYKNDINMHQAQQALERQERIKQALQMEQRKQYFLSSTPEQRFLDRVNQFRQQ